MSQIITRLSNFLAPYKKRILISLLCLILSVIGYKVYKKRGALDNKNDAKFKDVANLNKNTDRIDVYYFYADWCPHCKNARPEWDEFKKEYNDKKMGNLVVFCKEFDCSDSDKASTNNAEYGVESYPTIKVYIDKDMKNPIEYDATIKKERLIELMKNLSEASSL